MATKQLLRKNMEPRCVYCMHSTALSNGQHLTCMRRGIVDGNDKCRKFCYDPLRRVPGKSAPLRTNYSAADFSIEESAQ